MSDEIEVATGVAVLGMVGAWAEETEKHLTERLGSSRSKVTLTRLETERLVGALKDVQEGLAAVLNGDAELHHDHVRGEAYIDPSDLMQASSGTDHIYWRLYDHLNKHLVEGKSKRLSLSLSDVRGYLNILDATKNVLGALNGDDDGPGSGGGPDYEGGTRVVDNVIYPDIWHQRAA